MAEKLYLAVAGVTTRQLRFRAIFEFPANTALYQIAEFIESQVGMENELSFREAAILRKAVGNAAASQAFAAVCPSEFEFDVYGNTCEYIEK